MRRFRFLGKIWRVIRRSMDDAYGQCHYERRLIELDTSLDDNDRKLLEISIHELLHAAHWIHDEQHVDQLAKDISRFLWAEGFRRLKK